MRPLRRAALASALLLAAEVPGELTVIAERQAGNQRSVVVRCVPRDASSARERAESILLGGLWTSPVANHPDVALIPAQVGPYAGLQVVVQPSGDKPFEFEVRGQAAPVAVKADPVPPFATPPARVGRAPRKSATPSAEGTHRIALPASGGPVIATAAALGIADADLASVRFGHHGTTLPTIPIATDRVLLWVPDRSTLANAADAVFLEFSSPQPSAPASTRAAFLAVPIGGPEVAIERSLVHAPNLVYDRSSFEPVGERFLIHGAGSGQTRTANVPFADKLTTTTLTLAVEVHGRNASTPDPDHFASFSVQGVVTPSLAWEGRTIATASWSLSLPALAVPNPLPVLHSVPAGSPGGGGTDLQGLESLSLAWTGLPRVGTSGVLDFTVGPSATARRVTVGGFPAGTTATEVVVLELTTGSPVVLTDLEVRADADGGAAVGFEAPAGGGRYLVARLASLTVAPAPAPIAPLPTLPGAGTPLRAIYVRPPALAASLAPLVAVRGAGVVELDPQAAYDHFDAGRDSAEAIRDALAWIIGSSPDAADFPDIVLVGHASIDRKNYLGNQSGAQVPTFLELGVVQSLGIQNENSIDFPYGTLFGQDNLLDAHVSRIPVRTAAELDIVVNRTLSWETQAPTLQALPRRAMFIVDEDSLFQGDVPLWPALWSEAGRASDTLIVGSQTTEKAEIKAALETTPEGRSFLMYMGHGTSDRWSGQNILQTSDVATFDTQGRWPIVATFTCLNAFYASATVAPPCLSEGWILAANRGAIASIAPTGVDVYSAQRLFPITMLELLSDPQPPATIGEWMMRTQNEFVVSYPLVDRTAKELLLFGDSGVPLALGTQESRLGDWWILH